MEGVCSAQVQAQTRAQSCVMREGEMNKRKLGSFALWRHALCALLSRRGAAAEEDPADRVSIVGRCQLVTPPVPKQFRLALRELWLHRRTEYRHRIPICGGEARSAP